MTISIGFGLGIIYTQNIVSAGGPPVNTVAPSIAITSGGGYAGSTYTATAGTWDTGSPTGQWYSDGVAIGGETSSTYVMTLAKEGTVIKYRETNGGVTADSNTIEMWIPSDATGTLVAQFDIRRGITEASGLVSRWDGFAASEFLTQATGASQPLYSATGFDTDAPGMTFDGSDDYLEGLVIAQRPAARTLVFGIRIGAFVYNANVVASNASGGFNFRYPAAGTLPGVADNGVALRAAGTSAASTATTYFASCRFIPSGAYSFFRNGVAIGSVRQAGAILARRQVRLSVQISKELPTTQTEFLLQSLCGIPQFLTLTSEKLRHGWLGQLASRLHLMLATHMHPQHPRIEVDHALFRL